MGQILISECFCLQRQSPQNDSIELVAVVPCGHVSHKACISAWWDSCSDKREVYRPPSRGGGEPTHRTCPTCRGPVFLNRQTVPEGYIELFGLTTVDPKEERKRRRGEGGNEDGTTRAAAGGGGGGGEGEGQARIAGVPSSDGMTQDTQEIVQDLIRERRKRKGRRVISDDEDDEHKSLVRDGKGKGKIEFSSDQLKTVTEEIEEIRREKQAYERHAIDLEEQLKRTEEDNEHLRGENEELNEELSRMDADVLEELEELNLRLEKEAKEKDREIAKLKIKLDRRDIKLKESLHRSERMEQELAKEGDSGRIRIAELEKEIDGFKDQLLHARVEKDKLEMKVDRHKEEAKARVAAVQEERQKAIDRLKKEKNLVALLKTGNKNYEHKLMKLKRKLHDLQKKKGKAILESDSDGSDTDENFRTATCSAAIIAARTSTTNVHAPASLPRQPLASTSHHNLTTSTLSSSPAPPPAYRVKNHSTLMSPVKVNYLENPQPDADHQELAVQDLDDGGSSEIEIVEPVPMTTNSTGMRRDRLGDTKSGIRSDYSGPPVASKYFASSSNAATPSNQRNPFPSLHTSTSNVTSGSTVLGKRTFERSKSDKYLPDFAREGVVVSMGPKRKVKRV